jgi:hypothetical protein
MMLRPFVFAALLGFCVPCVLFAAKERACLTAEQASKLVDKDVCITAHVYDVVETAEGTRFLDICSPGTPDPQCQFTIVSYRNDRDSVGDLERYRSANVRIRGKVQSMRGRVGLVLSHERQFRGGPPKFRPNPQLLHGFAGDESRPAMPDPNLRVHGAARSFMNNREQVKLPAK